MSLSGTRIGNLKRHLQRSHSTEAKELEIKEATGSQPKANSEASGATSGRQLSMTQFYTTDKITITMTKESFVDGLVSMVAKEGIALRFFSTPGCK